MFKSHSSVIPCTVLQAGIVFCLRKWRTWTVQYYNIKIWFCSVLWVGNINSIALYRGLYISQQIKVNPPEKYFFPSLATRQNLLFVQLLLPLFYRIPLILTLYVFFFHIFPPSTFILSPQSNLKDFPLLAVGGGGVFTKINTWAL